jgi:hypothetical protein
MSRDTFMLKFAFTCKQLMNAPVGSKERAEWVRIKRELEMQKATALTIAH